MQDEKPRRDPNKRYFSTKVSFGDEIFVNGPTDMIIKDISSRYQNAEILFICDRDVNVSKNKNGNK